MKKLIKYYYIKFIKIICALAVFLSKLRSNTEGVAFLRTDNIGDYVLFRNFLPFIRQSEKYKNKKIILIGNNVWKELVTHFDKEFVDVFFGIDIERFKKNKWYKLKILFQLNQLSIHTLINTVQSRTLIINELSDFINAPLKITCQGDDVNLGRLVTDESNKLFSEIIPNLSNTEFEFFRNKTFLAHLISQPIELNKTYFSSIKKQLKPQQILIFPSAQSAKRRWDTAHFAALIDTIGVRFPDSTFLILGSKNDIQLGEKIINSTSKKLKINNLCGKTSLIELVETIAESCLLISNESSAVHIAAAVETPTVCIANGERFNRFSPYPLSITNLITYFFPNDDFYKKENNAYLTEKYQYASDLNINDIQPNVVFPIVKKLLENEFDLKR
jgi:ADP-heptose:LPS heptosyltransferase